ncbi:hypothetical protein EJB05_56233, partial [Eragrostis curvula]
MPSPAHIPAHSSILPNREKPAQNKHASSSFPFTVFGGEAAASCSRAAPEEIPAGTLPSTSSHGQAFS